MIIHCHFLLHEAMLGLSIERVWKPNHAKPVQANDMIILWGHISIKVRIPGTRLPALCRKAGTNNLPCVHVARRTEWCWRSSPQRPLRYKSGCLVAVCMHSVSNSWHSPQMFKPPLHPPPHSSPLTGSGRAGGREETEACFAQAFLNILLCLQLPLLNYKAEDFFKRKAGVVEYFSPLREWQHPVALYVSVSLNDCFNFPFFPRFSPSTFFFLFLEFFLTPLQRSLGKVGRFSQCFHLPAKWTGESMCWSNFQFLGVSLH